MTLNPRTTRTARRLFRACQIDGTVDGARARRVVARLASSRAHGDRALLEAFHRRVQLDGRRRTAVVERDLRLKYGAGLVISFRTAPAMIGGVWITVGSDVYDGSVRGRLAALEARL